MISLWQSLDRWLQHVVVHSSKQNKVCKRLCLERKTLLRKCADTVLHIVLLFYYISTGGALFIQLCDLSLFFILAPNSFVALSITPLHLNQSTNLIYLQVWCWFDRIYYRKQKQTLMLLYERHLGFAGGIVRAGVRGEH